MLDDIRSMGFELEHFGGTDFQVTGVPSDTGAANLQSLMDGFLEQIKHEQPNADLNSFEKIAWAMAMSTSIRYGQMLTLPEMKEIIERLLSCHQPNFEKRNRPTFIKFTIDQLGQQFR
jgi:DNA mismatch repair protein MutL